MEIHSASRTILVHNHPTGDPEPSQHDIEATRMMVEAGRVVGIAVADHVICGRPGIPHEGAPGYISLRALGIIPLEVECE